VAVLSRVLADHPDLRQRLITAIVPEALRSTVEHSLATLPTSTIPLVVGLAGLLLSGTGVVFSAYQTLNHVAAVRYRSRAGFVSRYVRVFAMLLAGALAVGALTAVATALPGQPAVQRAAAGARVGAGCLRGAAARCQVAAGAARAGPGAVAGRHRGRGGGDGGAQRCWPASRNVSPPPASSSTSQRMAPRQPMMVHRNAATAAASRAFGQATIADFHRSVAVVITALLLLAALAPLWINSERIDKTTIRQGDVQAVAEHWASEAGWSVIGVTATGDRVLVDATGPNPAPDLAMLRQDLDAASLGGLDVWISLVTVSYQPLLVRAVDEILSTDTAGG
jgi:hypothetical protein